MPNWCNNTATLTFPDDDSAGKFYEHLKKVKSDEEHKDENGNLLSVLGHFVPEPNYNSGDGWYWWRVNNWGTKWDVSLYQDDWIDDNTVILGFDTAWGPPTLTYEAMLDQDIIVEATYYEPGMCFVGRFSSDASGTTHFEFSEIEDPQELRDYIGEELDDEYNISEYLREYLEEENENDNDSGVENFG